jgi:cyclic pyranopterin phosphate synthase
LKTCLYDNGVLDIRTLLRSGASDEEVTAELRHAFRNRPANGHEAEEHRSSANPVHESMSTIGG